MLKSQRLSKTRRLAGAQRGFSFIEILVVMGIISVLVGGVIVAIGLWGKKRPEFDTKNVLNKTKALIEDWKNHFEQYPPSDIKDIAARAGIGTVPKSPGNNINGPIEAIYQALSWPGFPGSPEWNDKERGNTDEDELSKAINKHGAPGLFEIVDGYENPLVYFDNRDYAEWATGGGPSYISRTRDGRELESVPVPYKNEEDGGFRNPETFQLWSMGPDGEPNTDDDITTWK
jgi:prepilin-type N-terminal cleavage/methylation domain-containing protein